MNIHEHSLAGTGETCEQAFRLHYRTLLHLATTMVGTNQAEDIVQTTFLKAHQHWNELAGTNRIGWLYTIMKNNVLDYRRYTNRRPTAPLYENSGQGWEIEPIIEQRELQDIVNEALNYLTPYQQAAIRAQYIEDKPLLQIAEETHVPFAAIRSRISLGKERLREELTSNPQIAPKFDIYLQEWNDQPIFPDQDMTS